MDFGLLGLHDLSLTFDELLDDCELAGNAGGENPLGGYSMKRWVSRSF